LSRLSSTANFQAAAKTTIGVAGELYGADSDERKAIESAWQQVSVI
jgi:Zn-dependent metalloprotease